MKPFRLKLPGLCFAALVWAGISVAQAHELKSLEIIGDGAQAYVKLRFSSIGFEKDFPSYFQKNDASGVLITSFLETGSAFALGKYTPAPGNPWIEEVRLKRFTSPRGKVFLGLELKMKKSPVMEVSMTPMAGGVLKLSLDKNSREKYSWSLDKSAVTPIASAEQPVDPKSAATVKQPIDPGPPPVASKPLPTTAKVAVVSSKVAAPAEVVAVQAAAKPAPKTTEAPVASKSTVAPPKTEAATKTAAAPAISKVTAVTPPAVVKPTADSKSSEVTTTAPKKGGLIAANLVPAAKAKEAVIPASSKPTAPPVKQPTVLKNTPPVAELSKPLPTSVKAAAPVKQPIDPGPSAVVSKPVPATAKAAVVTSKVAAPTAVATTPVAAKPTPKSAEAPVASKPTVAPPKTAAATKTAAAPAISKVTAVTSPPVVKPVAVSKSSEATTTAPKIGGLIAANLVPAAKAKEAVIPASSKPTIPSVKQPTFPKNIPPVAELSKPLPTSVKAAAPVKQPIDPGPPAVVSKPVLATAKAAVVTSKVAAPIAVATTPVASKPALVSKSPEAPAAAPKKGGLIAAGLVPVSTVSKSAPPKAPGFPAATAPAVKEKAPATAVALAPVSKSAPVNPAQTGLKSTPTTAAKKPALIVTVPNPELAAELQLEKQKAEEEKQNVEEESQRIVYNSYGRRDPFIPVEEGSVDIGIDVDHVRLVGVVWRKQPLAVLEHTLEAGVSFTVQPGDPVHNGRVSRITRDAVTFDINEYGIPRSYTLKLASSQERTKK